MKKIAILTFHNAINYGAILQCYALQETIKLLGNDVYVLDYQCEYLLESYSLNPFKKTKTSDKILVLLRWILKFRKSYGELIKSKKLKKFINNELNLSKKYYKDTIESANEEFDCFIVGSDQVWNSILSNFDSSYFLDFVHPYNRRIAYAASIGKKFLNGYEYENLKDNLKKYYKISCREEKCTDIIKQKICVECETVLDPTLLISKDKWLSMTRPTIEKSRYILIYLVQGENNLIDAAFSYAEKISANVISFSFLKTNKKYKYLPSESIESFLTYILNAECIFTTSFHGIVFSIIFNKNFYYELSNQKNNNNERLINLCQTLCIECREIEAKYVDSYENINYLVVNEKLDNLRKSSIMFITNSIKGE